MDANEFRRLGHEGVAWSAACRERMEGLPVMSAVVPGMTEEELRARNPGIMDRGNGPGCFFVTPAALKGVQMIRVSIGGEASGREHVDGVWKALGEAAL
jgi:hypothetical protein